MSETKYATFHMCISVRGMLNWSDRETKRNLRTITKDDGSHFSSVHEFRNTLMDELAKGHEVIPMCKDCDNFDFKKGCLGHPKPAEVSK